MLRAAVPVFPARVLAHASHSMHSNRHSNRNRSRSYQCKRVIGARVRTLAVDELKALPRNPIVRPTYCTGCVRFA